QTPHCDSRRAFGDPRFGFFGPGGAGDVEVQPRGVFGELFQEHGGGDGATPAAAGVHDVGNAALDDVFVFFVEGHAPEFLSGFVFGFAEAGVELIVVGEDARVYVAERDDHGAGERGAIDQVSAAQLAGVEEAVGEDEAAF